MGKNFIWVILSITVALSMLFMACPADTTPTPTAATPTPTKTSPTPTPETHWWDEWGEPQYGGTLTIGSSMIDIVLEPQDPRTTQFAVWIEALFADNALTDRAEYSFGPTFTPLEYRQGWVAEGWEQTDPLTVTVKIKQGIKWQDKAPAFGRDFTADDVVYSFDRVFLTGSGFTEENAGQYAFFYQSQMPTIERVVKVDDYTVQFELKSANAMAIYDVVEPFLTPGFVPYEWDELTDEERQDWHNAAGTGPFMLTEYVPGTSLTASANPDYWGYDERHPDNKLPYLDAIRVIVIADMSTSIAALKTAKIDMLADDRVYPSLTDVKTVQSSNPEIIQFMWPGVANGVFCKWDTDPFTDINVRKALQLAIDIEGIAEHYYEGTIEGKPAGLLSPLVGESWAVSYDDWPADLQAEYSYDVDAAKALLADAGYPNGFDTEILASSSDDPALLLVIKDAFAQIDVNMEIVQMDMITQRTAVMEGNYNQLLWASSSGAVSPPTSAIGTFWSTKGEKVGGAGGVNDPAYDALVDEFLAATTMEEAQAAFREADMYALRQHYAAVICPILKPELCQPWLKGWAGEHFWGQGGWFIRSRMWVDEDVKAEYVK